MGLSKAKHALLEQLIADGTRYIFGNPGTTEQGFMDALQDYPQLKFILALHESVVVCMGDAYARATRRPAFVELHTAPGLGNGIGMIHNAARGRTPMVVYAGQADSRGVLQEPVLSGDLVGMAKSVCKWSAEAHHAFEVPQLVRRAMKVAADPPQGPVFLSLPLDVLEQEAEVTIAPTPFTRWRSRPEPAAVREAAAILAGSRRPAIIVGDGVAISDGQAEVTALAELIGSPIYGGSSSELNVPFEHPLWSGQLNAMTSALAGGQLDGVDTVLLIGTAETAALVPPPVGPLPSDARVVEINPQTWELGKNFPVDIAIAADAKETVAELIDLIRGRYTADQVDAARQRHEAAIAHIRADRAQRHANDQRQRDQVPIVASRLMEELGAALPADAAIFDEAITSGATLDQYLRPMPGRYFRIRGGGIGAGMPGAVGLQLAFPDQPAVGIVGDGSAMYTITALWTAAHHNIPVTWVVCHNEMYRVLKINTLIHMGEASAGRKFVEMDLTNPSLDFAGLAETFGVRGRRVERPEDLGDALRDAIAHPGPALVDVVLDGSLPGQH